MIGSYIGKPIGAPPRNIIVATINLLPVTAPTTAAILAATG